MFLKRFLCLACVVCISVLGGCRSVADRPSEELSTSGNETTKQDSDDARLVYYEQLVNELKSEILTLKADLFSAKSEYEERLQELEAGREASPSGLPFTYTVEGDRITITAYTGTDVNVTIPSQIDGKRVVAIGDKAFLNNKTVQSVVLPEGVEAIGWFAFSGCISLGAISIPSSVASISYGAFENCPSALTIFCPGDSYAQKYAQSYGIATAG